MNYVLLFNTLIIALILKSTNHWRISWDVTQIIGELNGMYLTKSFDIVSYPNESWGNRILICKTMNILTKNLFHMLY